MFLTDIPWKVMSELLILDYDDGWEKLASEVGCTWQERQKIQFEHRYGKSPTREVITKWGYQNVTMCDLYHVLLKIDRIAEAGVVEQFLKSNNLPIQEQRLNDFSNEKAASSPMKGNSKSTCQSLQQINPNTLPRPSERNLLQQPKVHSHLPTRPDQPPFHKPLNTDGHNRNDVINLNKVTNHKEIDRLPNVDFDGHNQNASINVNKASTHKDIDCVPKVDHEEGAMAAKPQPQSKNINPLLPLLELGCLYTYKEISCATNGFSEDNVLGKGAFGCVYYGRLKETDCAIKKLSKDFSEVSDAITNLKKNTLEELMIQLKFRHPNVVNLYGYSLDPDETCFVYEYMENGSLEDCLACEKNSPPLSWCERLKIAEGTACGLQYLHTQKVPVIHGDVKSSNILIDKHKEAKIGDFGLAMFATRGTDTGILTHVSKNMTGSLFGTVAYMPPEFPRSSGRQCLAGDVYSFGVVLHEILTGQKAYDERRLSKRFLMEYIDQMLESPDENLNQDKDINTDVINKLKDPKAGPCFQNTIVDLYLLATQCTSSKKKDRPLMLSVFDMLKRINDKLREMMVGVETKGNTMPYKLQQMYDERNQGSSSSVPAESLETLVLTKDESCNHRSVAEAAAKGEEDFSFVSGSSNSLDSLPLSESLRKEYEEKRLPETMDSFFANYYSNLTDCQEEEDC